MPDVWSISRRWTLAGRGLVDHVKGPVTPIQMEGSQKGLPAGGSL
jgi:hypothetical protein